MPKANSQKKYEILGVGVDAVRKSQVLELVSEQVEHHTQTAYIVKPYVEFMTLAQKDSAIAGILNDSYLCLADGVSLQWAASFLYGQPSSKPTFIKVIRSGLVWLQRLDWRNQILPEKMAGVSLTKPILKLAEERAWRIGVLGGPSDHTMTAKQLYKKFPKLTSVETWNGYYDLNDETKLVEEIAASKLDVLFVALGFPKQELFMAKYKQRVGAKLMIGEGGSFDYDELGGEVKRAPSWMQKSGLEWLWRLFQQPKRFKRQLAIPRFVWAVYRQAKVDYKLRSAK